MNTTARLLLRIAWRNVARHWRHSLAALGTMMVGFLALALFQGYLDELMGSQLRAIYARNMLGEMLVRRPGAGTREARIHPELYRLDKDAQAFIDDWLEAHKDEIKTRVRSLVLAGIANAGNSTAQFWGVGFDVAEGRMARRDWLWNTWAGRPLEEKDASGTILALGLGSLLGCERADKGSVIDERTGIPLPKEREFQCRTKSLMLTSTSARGRMNALEADIIGLSSTAARDIDQRLLWLPLPFAQTLASTEGVTSYVVLLNDSEAGPRMRADLKEKSAAAGLNLQVIEWLESEQAEVFRRGMQMLAVYRSLVVMVILIIAGAAVLTSMMKTVRERTREVGTLRSLGYLRRHILIMFALESSMLAMLSGLLGLASALILTAGINAAGITYKAGLFAESIPFRIGYSPSAYAWGFLFLSLVAMLAAMGAARKVAAMRIADQLSS
jgi:putative ABC transport system permease protein